MIDTLSAYLPMDRRLAVASGESLPDRTRGAALFADISGFTPLTGALAAEMGRQRGAEEVLNYINPIYEALVAELYRYRGSVVAFAGDSITCWLDGDDGRRAVACALAMQQIMARFAAVTTPGGSEVALSIKVAVAAGPARRFLAGDPAIHNFEALAGATLERLAAAEGMAERGEIVASQEVADRLGDALSIAAWRPEPGALPRYAVVAGLALDVAPDPWPELPPGSLAAGQLRPWLDAPVYARLAGGASYLAELRPVTSIFVRFGGIDYDGDDAAGAKLDAYVRRVQSVLARYEGHMLQLTIGDKGSNLLAVLGAPVAHDDDETRAVAAALDLRALPPDLSFITPVQIGVSRGLAWAGAVGGRLRCIYSVMGDEVNMAARLMGKAAPGQVLVNQHVAEATARRYRYGALGQIQVKGRDEPLPISEALGRRTGSAEQMASLFESPLVGRETVLAEMEGYLDAAGRGQGQVVRLQGVAGVGKSHLAATFARQASARGWRVALGTCQSISRDSAYTPWRGLLSDLLGLPPGAPPAAQARQLRETLLAANPDWHTRLPLLGDLLGLPLPDNEITAALDARMRQQALLALVAEIVQAWAGRQPLLLLLEDVHWLDELSADLAETVARAIGRVPVLLLVVQRPPLQEDRPILPALDALAYYHSLPLGDLSPAGVAALVGHRLDGPFSPLVQALVLAQAQGNPFFAEELVDALREAGYVERRDDSTWALSGEAFDALLDGNCLVKVEGAWQMVDNPPLSAVALDIPDSVHGTVLARMDRLPEAHKLTLKVVSVIGRTFSLRTLADVHPTRPGTALLQRQIDDMGARDFVRLEVPEPEVVYIFKHNTTQEVAYGTLLFAQRQALHATVAGWHEQVYGGDAPLEELTLDSALAPYYPLLVHHWRHAENEARERHYTGLAGEQAVKQYANESAVRYFSRALDLTPGDDLEDRYRLLLGRESAHDILATRPAQARDLETLAELASALADIQKRAAVNLRQAHYAHELADYAAAFTALRQAIGEAVQVGDTAVEIKAYQTWGFILRAQGHYQAAQEQVDRARDLAHQTGNAEEEAHSLYNIASLHWRQGEFATALDLFRQAQGLYHALDKQTGHIDCLYMFGVIYNESGDYVAAQESYEQALALSRAIGWRHREANLLNTLGNNYFDLGDYPSARAYLEQARQACQEIGFRRGEAISWDLLGLAHAILGEGPIARQQLEQALVIKREIANRSSEGYSLSHLGFALHRAGALQEAADHYAQALQLRRELGQQALAADDLAGLARTSLDRGRRAEALALAKEVLTWLAENGHDGVEYPVLIYLTCYRVLQAAADDDPTLAGQARTTLEAGCRLLHERAGRIQDKALRRSFLENVPFNRDLLAACQSAGI
jgi:predicted ATPase/class 3 adenylate cyclase